MVFRCCAKHLLTPIAYPVAEEFLDGQLEHLEEVGIAVGAPILGSYRSVRQALDNWSFLSSTAESWVIGKERWPAAISEAIDSLAAENQKVTVKSVSQRLRNLHYNLNRTQGGIAQEVISEAVQRHRQPPLNPWQSSQAQPAPVSQQQLQPHQSEVQLFVQLPEGANDSPSLTFKGNQTSPCNCRIASLSVSVLGTPDVGHPQNRSSCCTFNKCDFNHGL